MRHLPILAASLLIAAPAVAHGPFDGYWAAEEEWCDADMFYTDQSAIMLDLPVMQGYFGECIIDSFDPVGSGEGDAWRAGLSCTGANGEWEYQAIFAVGRDAEGAPKTLVEIGLEDGRVRMLRQCP